MSLNKKDKLIFSCPNCGKRLRVPKIKKSIRINCPSCLATFTHNHSIFNISIDIKRLMLFGSLGGFVGFIVTEIIRTLIDDQMPNNVYKSAAITFGILGLCIGGFLGATEGFYKKNKYRFKYGMQMGIIFGTIGGMIAAVIAQFLYNYINTITFFDSTLTHIVGRSIAWSIFGTLLGISYGIKQNTLGDLKSGALSGAIGGSIGGMLFDPIALLVPINEGSVARLVGFVIIGLSLGTAIQFLQERAIKAKQSDMYKPLTKALPENLRFLE